MLWFKTTSEKEFCDYTDAKQEPHIFPGNVLTLYIATSCLYYLESIIPALSQTATFLG